MQLENEFKDMICGACKSFKKLLKIIYELCNQNQPIKYSALISSSLVFSFNVNTCQVICHVNYTTYGLIFDITFIKLITCME